MKYLFTIIQVQFIVTLACYGTFGQVQKIYYSGTNVTIEVSGSIYDNDNSPSLYDPLAGVLVWGVSNEQDGSATITQVLQGTHYYKSQPDVLNFTSNPGVNYIYVCAINDDQLSDPQGSYTVKVNGVDYTITIDNVIYLEDFYPSKVKKIHYSGTNVSIEVSNSIYDNDNSPSLYDPLAGVLVWGVSNEQDGSASVAQVLQGTHYYKNQPDVWNFISNPAVDYIYACAINDDPLSDPQGSYTIKVNGVDYTITIDNVIYLEDDFIVPGELVAYYPFNGNANDESGNGNDGIVIGAVLTNDRFENINSAYYFDGIDDEIILGSEPFNFTNHSYAISVWAKWDIASNSGTHIFDKQGYPVNGGGGYRLYTGATGEIIFAISTEVFGSGFVEYNTHIIPNLDTWYHLVANVDVTGSTTVYINSEAKVMDLTEPLIGNAFELKLGRRIDFNGSRFKGIIDDVRIYNRELSQAEIDELYHEGGWPGGNGLVAYYPFNGNANDESGNGNDGTVYGATLTADRFSNANSAYRFDGIDDYILAPHRMSLMPLNEISYGGWFKVNDFSQPHTSLVSKTESAAYSLILNHTNQPNQISGYIRINSQYYVVSFPTSTISTDWFFVMISYDGAEIKIYLNGVQIDNLSISGTIVPSTTPLIIGAEYNGGLIETPYKGYADDVRIYNIALSEAEILELYHEGGWGTNITISVHSPNGGEVWGMGTEQSITWSSIDIIDVKIEFSSNNGASWHLVTESTPSTGIYLWTVPAIHTIQALVKITDVADEENNDQSDDPFTIEPVTAADIFNSTIPDQIELMQNYPNPFNPVTTIYYGLPNESSVRILIFDILGSNVMRFTKDNQPAGYHTIKFDATALPSGIYFYRIQAGDFIQTKKMILLK